VWPKELDSIVSANIINGGIWEEANINKMTEILKGKPQGWSSSFLKTKSDFHILGIVIDGGANIGEFTIIAAALGHVVFAFEPVRSHVEMIKRSLALNGFSSNVRLFRNGLSDYNGNSSIALTLTNKGGSSVNFKRQITEQVDLIRMDELYSIFTKDYSDLDMLFWKADIEGWEERHFNGANLLYDHYRPKYIQMEMMSNELRVKMCNLEIFLRELMKHYDIKLFYTDGKKQGPEISEDTVAEFASTFPTQVSHVYDMWLTKKESETDK